MITESEQIEILEATGNTLVKKIRLALGLGIVIGLVCFFVGLLSGDAVIAWQALLYNTIFFAGLAHGCLIFSIIFTITGAKWGRPIKRFAESGVFFFPVSWLLLIMLFFGMDSLYEWTDPSKIILAKTWWLNKPFFIGRQLILHVITGLVATVYVISSIRPDLLVIKRLKPERLTPFALFLLKNVNEEPEQYTERMLKRHNTLAPIYAVLYAVLTCVTAFDWIMSLDQEWYSTLFGFQYSIANVYAAAAFLVILSTYYLRRTGLDSYFSKERHNDLSRLLFAAALMWTYFIFSQVLVIWYANLPEETPFLILRMRSEEWSWLFELLFVILFLVPFIGLLTKTACRSHRFSSIVAVIVLFGLWTEKYFLTVPSIQENTIQGTSLPGFDFGIIEAGVTFGVASLFLLTVIGFLKSVPTLPIADPVFNKQAGR